MFQEELERHQLQLRECTERRAELEQHKDRLVNENRAKGQEVFLMKKEMEDLEVRAKQAEAKVSAAEQIRGEVPRLQQDLAALESNHRNLGAELEGTLILLDESKGREKELQEEVGGLEQLLREALAENTRAKEVITASSRIAESMRVISG